MRMITEIMRIETIVKASLLVMMIIMRLRIVIVNVRMIMRENYDDDKDSLKSNDTDQR